MGTEIGVLANFDMEQVTGIDIMNDPIVDEIRRIRDAHAASFNYDLEAIFEDIKKGEGESGRKLVSFIQGEKGQAVNGADKVEPTKVELNPINVTKRAG